MGSPIYVKQLTTLFIIFITLLTSPLLAAYNSAVILQYHHVSNKTPPITSLSPEKFKQHMDYLKAEQFNIVPLPQLIENIKNKRPIKDKTIAITFDDGYLNVFENARPILKANNWPYTVFINSKFIDDKYSRHMSWDQLRTIAKEGATIANHTKEHHYLVRKPKNLTQEKWQQQIADDIIHVESRIKAEIGHDYKYLAYPYGEFDVHTLATIQKLGFIGIGQHSGAVGHHSDLTRLPRFPASGIYANLDRLKLKLVSLNMPVEKLVSQESVLGDNPPTLTMSIKLDDIRKRQLQCFASGDRTTIAWNHENQFSAVAPKALSKGRSRYNCTAPSKNDSKRYYWFSQPWINGDEHE